MIRRSPAENYLKYLLAHPSLYEPEELAKLCDKDQIDPIGQTYLDQLKAGLRVPTDFHPLDDTHLPSWRFLQQHRIHYYFFPDACMRKSFVVLRKPRVRELVETMLISHAPLEEISKGVSKLYTLALSKKDLERYRGCFFDVDLLDSTELRALMAYRLESLEFHGNADVQKYAKVVKRASYNDPRKLAADLPFSPLSGAVTRMRMGGNSKADLVEVLAQVQRNAALRAYEVSASSSPHDSSRTIEFVTAVEKVTNALALLQRPDENLTEQLTAIALKTNKVALPELSELSQGAHSESTNALPETQESYGDDDLDHHTDEI